MNLPTYYIGIDISSKTYTVAVCTQPGEYLEKPKDFENNLDGFSQMLCWFEQQGITPENTVCCMEATGVYGEALAYYLHEQSYCIAVEPPLNVKRAFFPTGHKNDRVDSLQIADYALRFFDRLTFWQPREAVLEEIRVFLATRERLVVQRTAHKNALYALRRKVERIWLAEQVHEECIEQLNQHIQKLELQIQQLIDTDPDLAHRASLLISIPGVGLLLAANMLIVFAGRKTVELNSKKTAAYLGIAPFQYQSGSSVSRPAKSRHYGPARIRKLLHMAGRSLLTHHPATRSYFARKKEAGKHSYIILNNISNKLVRIMCAVVRDNTPYIPNFHSIRPTSLQIT